ncbi:hypothetical protein [Ruminococcus sp.]|uniref:hypothetical protein n=1 Tax=Ruminococcus sp. TaxID=41978 RepID=UPI0025F6B901|nr:hypothetical protein [Ruminococcus sp.]MBQ8964992.1 hypothetical protein [Ruminococcus sp.]
MTNTNTIKDMELSFTQLETVSGGITSEDMINKTTCTVTRYMSDVEDTARDINVIVKNPSILITIIKSWF